MKNKKNVAFLVMRYGDDINGGAEYHCRMLAERLVPYYNVEVLTTCVKDYISGGNVYSPGTEILNGVVVRRFIADPDDREKEGYCFYKSRKSRRIRSFLYKMHLLTPLSYIFPLWTYRLSWELQQMKSNVFYSTSLFSYIRDNKENYNAILAFSVEFPLVYYAALYAPERTIIIPTMHYCEMSFRSVMTHIFSRVAYIGFNTIAEQKLGRRLVGRSIAPNGIISVGIEVSHAANWDRVKKDFQLPDGYLLYVGRVDAAKLNDIIAYFINYKKQYPTSNLKFVLLGGLFMDKIERDDIIYTGFVSDEVKTTIIQHADLVVNPSLYESLSLILLETLTLGAPMIVNGRCAVLKEHCRLSQGAVDFYMDERQFITKLNKLETTPSSRRAEIVELGQRYVKENYDWSLIMSRLQRVIESI